jgi:hypothetical protein
MCPTHYIRAANLVNYMPVFSHVIMRSAPQCHHHDDGGCGGQRRQPYVGQHADTPPPQFSSRIPCSQSACVLPHAGDGTGTMFQENQVKRFVTLRLVGPTVGIVDGRRKSGPGSGGMFCWSSQDRTGYGSSATMFLVTKRRIASLMSLIMHLRYASVTPLDRVVCTRLSGSGTLAFGQTGYSFYVEWAARRAILVADDSRFRRSPRVSTMRARSASAHFNR